MASLTDPTRIASLRRILENAPKILLIRLRSLGDSILTLPLVEALHKWRARLQIDILIESHYAAVFHHHPAIHEVLVLRSCAQPSMPGWTRFQAVRQIRKRNYAVVLNLHGGTTSLLFTLISGADTKIGQESHRGSWFYTARIPPSHQIWQRPSLHTIEHQLSIMRWLGLPVPAEPRGHLHIDPIARKQIQDRLTGIGVSSYFLVQPTATLKTKQWSTAKFAELGDQLLRWYGIPIIYTAAPHEISDLQEVQKAATETHWYWSDLRLEELFALIDGCSLFIGNDSGPTHAASALRKPVVAIWGSSDLQAWRPWGCEYEVVCCRLPCMPCPGYQCRAFEAPRCILDITVAQVVEACHRLLARTGKL